MVSLNVPLPGRVERVASDLAPALAGFERVRDRHTLVAKRLDGVSVIGHAADRARRALADAEPFELRIAGIGAFENPPLGPGPVCYLSVESPGLADVHRRLVDEFGAVEGFEGDGYVPHVTLARGGEPAVVDGLVGRDVEPVSWTASELEFSGPGAGGRAGSVSLR